MGPPSSSSSWSTARIARMTLLFIFGLHLLFSFEFLADVVCRSNDHSEFATISRNRARRKPADGLRLKSNAGQKSGEKIPDLKVDYTLDFSALKKLTAFKMPVNAAVNTLPKPNTVDDSQRDSRHLATTTSGSADAIVTYDLIQQPNYEFSYELFQKSLADIHTANVEDEANELQANQGKIKSLCFLGHLDNLDEVIQVFTRLLFLGQFLDRTVVIPPYFTILFDMYLLDLQGTATVSSNQELCDPSDAVPTVYKEADESILWPEALQDRKDKIIYIGSKELEKHSEDFFTNVETEESVRELLLSNMYPYNETRALVQNFINERFGKNVPFVAVHLDEQFDSCPTNANPQEKCAKTDPALVHWIIQRHAPELSNASIFVTTSAEFIRAHSGMLRAFRQNGAVVFDGPCPRVYECEMVEREIASRAAFFYSASSTPSGNEYSQKQKQQQQQPRDNNKNADAQSFENEKLVHRRLSASSSQSDIGTEQGSFRSESNTIIDVTSRDEGAIDTKRASVKRPLTNRASIKRSRLERASAERASLERASVKRASEIDRYILDLRRWRTQWSAWDMQVGVVEVFSVQQATTGGWKLIESSMGSLPALKYDADVSPASFKMISSRVSLQTHAVSHYTAYLNDLEQNRPNVPQLSNIPPNGVICQLGLFQNSNQVLNQFATLLHIGRALNRTVIIPPVISSQYDVAYFELLEPFNKMFFKGRQYQPMRTSANIGLCEPSNKWEYLAAKKNKKKDLTKFLSARKNKARLRRYEARMAREKESPRSFVNRAKLIEAPVVAVGAKDVARLGVDDPGLFSQLHAQKATREIAVKFVDKHFGEKPFVAVHLRFMEGKCYTLTTDMACDLDPDMLRWVLEKKASSLVDAPIFVATDNQRPDLELRFANAGAVFYQGPCNSYDNQCMIIDAEIAARSSYFYGLRSSTAATNIEKFRRLRQNGPLEKQRGGLPRNFDTKERNSRRSNKYPGKRMKWGGPGGDPAKYFESHPNESSDEAAVSLHWKKIKQVEVEHTCKKRVKFWFSSLMWIFFFAFLWSLFVHPLYVRHVLQERHAPLPNRRYGRRGESTTAKLMASKWSPLVLVCVLSVLVLLLLLCLILLILTFIQ